MAKRRTRKAKEKAKHAFTVSWKEFEASDSEASVKRQIAKAGSSASTKPIKAKNTNFSGTFYPYQETKRAIVKSLVLAVLILSLELVLYLAWN